MLSFLNVKPVKKIGPALRGIDLPTVGKWKDPSGVMGRGLKGGRAPALPAGTSVHVYMQNPIVREEPDFDRLAMTTSRRLMDVMRYNI